MLSAVAVGSKGAQSIKPSEPLVLEGFAGPVRGQCRAAAVQEGLRGLAYLVSSIQYVVISINIYYVVSNA